MIEAKVLDASRARYNQELQSIKEQRTLLDRREIELNASIAALDELTRHTEPRSRSRARTASVKNPDLVVDVRTSTSGAEILRLFAESARPLSATDVATLIYGDITDAVERRVCRNRARTNISRLRENGKLVESSFRDPEQPTKRFYELAIAERSRA